MSETREPEVRDVVPRVRHPVIFSIGNGLLSGESFMLINDHDPKPLYCRFETEGHDQFRREYLAGGPDQWQVRITRA